jgi:hypothetical protein
VARNAFVSTAAMAAAALHVEREYGYGYEIAVTGAVGHGGAGEFEVSTPDGGRFRLFVDRAANVRRLCEFRAADSHGCGHEGTYRPWLGAGDYVCELHVPIAEKEQAARIAARRAAQAVTG